MQPNSTNGVPAPAPDTLESLRQTIEKLQIELREQKHRNEELKKDRDEHRKMLFEQVKHLFGDESEWDDFDPKDYTLTIDDLLAIVDSK